MAEDLESVPIRHSWGTETEPDSAFPSYLLLVAFTPNILMYLESVLRVDIEFFSKYIYLFFFFVNDPVCFQKKKTVQNKTAMAHTILLVQPGSKPESRTYTDYESVNECMEVLCREGFL